MWRAQLFRIIFPEPESHELRVGNGISAEDIGNILGWIAKNFHHGPASEMLREMSDEEEERCYSEVRTLVTTAAKLHSRVQVQRSSFQWQSPKGLLGMTFDVRSELLAADRCHKLDDDDDEGCDGKKVKIVVSPAVKVFGDSNGENLQCSRTILKATVFLED